MIIATNNTQLEVVREKANNLSESIQNSADDYSASYNAVIAAGALLLATVIGGSLLYRLFSSYVSGAVRVVAPYAYWIAFASCALFCFNLILELHLKAIKYSRLKKLQQAAESVYDHLSSYAAQIEVDEETPIIPGEPKSKDLLTVESEYTRHISDEAILEESSTAVRSCLFYILLFSSTASGLCASSTLAANWAYLSFGSGPWDIIAAVIAAILFLTIPLTINRYIRAILGPDQGLLLIFIPIVCSTLGAVLVELLISGLLLLTAFLIVALFNGIRIFFDGAVEIIKAIFEWILSIGALILFVIVLFSRFSNNGGGGDSANG